MAGKKGVDNSKKAAGNARKADTAAAKAAAEDAKRAAAEAEQWEKGSKNTAKREADAAKKAEAARKKAERDAMLAAEEASLPARAQPKNAKTAPKKTRGLDLAQLDEGGDKASSSSLAALHASGIDNALDALSLTGGSGGGDRVDRHPERRFKAAYAAYEERRLREMDADGTGAGLRLNQRKERVKKEFEKSPENPFNQVTASYDTSREELAAIRERERAKIEQRLASPS